MGRGGKGRFYNRGNFQWPGRGHVSLGIYKTIWQWWVTMSFLTNYTGMKGKQYYWSDLEENFALQQATKKGKNASAEVWKYT